MKLLNYLRDNANLVLNYLIIVYAFTIPLDLKIYRFVVIFIAIFFVLQKDIKDRLLKIWANPFFKIFLVYILYQYLVIFWTPNKEYGFKFVNKYIEYFSLLFIIAVSIRKKFIKYTINSFLVSMFITEIVAYGIYFKIWSTSYHNLHPNDITPFYHHTIYSIYLSIAILIMFYKLLHERWSLFHYISIPFIITMTINLFLTDGRGGQIAFILSLIFILILKVRENKKYAILLILPFVIVFLGFEFSNVFHNRVILAINDIKNIFLHMNYCGSWGQRAGSYIVSLEIFKHYPIFGVGFHTPLDMLPQIVNDKYPYLKCIIHSQTIHLHSTLLMEVTQTGLIGLLLFLGIFGYLMFVKIEDKFINYLRIIFLINFIFYSFIDYSWHVSYMMKLFVLFSSIIISTYYETNNTEKDIF